MDLQVDPLNCGLCGQVCESGQACVDGVCGCAPGLTLCVGACVDTAGDPAHCGGCGVACTGGQFCQNSVCACPAGQQLCAAQCADTATDASNCGSCGTVCSAGQSCEGGACVGGAGGAAGTGGTGTGGERATGGDATGGLATGGNAGTGGAGTGGERATGGDATGGLATGGDAGTGGAGAGGDLATGGDATGGVGTGGTPPEGDYYVAPDGNDSNPGTIDQPFATMQRGQEAAQAGEIVYFRGGTYVYSGGSDVGVLLDKSGQPDQRINYWAYPGEQPVFDFFGLNPQARITGFRVRADWIHLRGLELQGVQQILTDVNESWCIHIQGSNNIFEHLNLHDNEGPGLFVNGGGNNQVINCDSHHNYDADRGGENADGFGCHSTSDGNVFTGCRAWYNSDDGFDFINSPGVCTVEHSWAFYNGFVPDTSTGAGNGAGIKAGGFTNNIPATIPRHVARFNVAWGNRRQGFYANHHEGGIDWINNTAYNNGQRNFDMLADEGAAAHYLRNNVAFGSGGTISNQTDSEIDDAYNSWNLSVEATAADFVSVSEDQAVASRQPDGSLPDVDFLKLAAGSDLIDAGQDVGFPYNGSAPDLGAFEY